MAGIGLPDSRREEPAVRDVRVALWQSDENRCVLCSHQYTSECRDPDRGALGLPLSGEQ